MSKTLSCASIPNLGLELPVWSRWCWAAGQDRVILVSAVTEQREPTFGIFCCKESLQTPSAYQNSSVLYTRFLWLFIRACVDRYTILYVQGIAFALMEPKVADCCRPISQSFRGSPEWLHCPSDYWLFPQLHSSHHQYDISCNLLKVHSVLQSRLSIKNILWFCLQVPGWMPLATNN